MEIINILSFHSRHTTYYNDQRPKDLDHQPPIAGDTRIVFEQLPLRTRNVVSNVRRVGIDTLDRLALLGDHMRQLGEDGPQLGDRRFYRLDCCAAGLDIVLLLARVSALLASENGRGKGIDGKNEEGIMNLIIHVLQLLHSAHCPVCMPFFSGDHIQRQQVGIPYSAFTLVLEVVPRVIIAWLLLEEEGRCKGLDIWLRKNRAGLTARWRGYGS